MHEVKNISYKLNRQITLPHAVEPQNWSTTISTRSEETLHTANIQDESHAKFWISEMPSNPQLTLVFLKLNVYLRLSIFQQVYIYLHFGLFQKVN